MSSNEQALRDHEHKQAKAEHLWECLDTWQKAERLSKEPWREWMERRTLQLFVECQGDTVELGRRVSLMINDYIDEI